MFLLTFDSRLLCLLNNALCAGMLPELLIQLIDKSASAKIYELLLEIIPQNLFTNIPNVETISKMAENLILQLLMYENV